MGSLVATPSLAVQRARHLEMDGAALELAEQVVDASDIDPTARVLGNVPIGTGPEVNLYGVTSNDPPHAGLGKHAPEAEPRAVELNSPLDIKRSEYRSGTIKRGHCGGWAWRAPDVN